MGQQIFDTPGADTFTVPEGVTELTVECFGPGGTGGDSPSACQAGGGGGGGGYALSVLSATPEDELDLYVADAGENSWFIDDTTVMAECGQDGEAGTEEAPGAGGAGGSGLGDVVHAGGAGGPGGDMITNGGGGGGAGGPSSAGSDGDDGDDGGAGGASGGTPAGAGGNALSPGNDYGGGGSGSTAGASTPFVGGIALVRVSWDEPDEIVPLTASLESEVNLFGDLTQGASVALEADVQSEINLFGNLTQAGAVYLAASVESSIALFGDLTMPSVTKYWTGNAQDTTDQWLVVFHNIVSGSSLQLTINEKTLELVYGSFSGSGDTAEAEMANALVAMINDSDIPEWQEVEAEVLSLYSLADVADLGYVLITAKTPGLPITMTASVNSTSLTVEVTTTVAGSGGANEQQEIQLSGAPTGGTFTLTFDGQTTSALAYNVSAAAMKTALEALSNIGSGDVNVSRAGAGTLASPYVWTVVFVGAMALADQPEITGNGSSLLSPTASLSHEETATGKHYWDNVDNWSDGVLPITNDVVYFANSTIACLYNIDQNAITLQALHFEASYTGEVGLRDWTGEYVQYRNKELKISATTLTIGRGVGEGSPFLRINTGSNACAGIQYGSGGANDLPCATLWKGANASNTWKIFKGSFAAAYFQTEVATIATLELGYESSPENDVTFIGGAGVTYGTSVKKWGGEATFNSAIPTMWNNGGEMSMVGSGGISSSFLLPEGICHWRSTGTIASLVVGAGATFDKRGYTGANTITTTQLHAGSSFFGHINNLTFSNPIQLVQCSIEEVTLDLGTNLSLAPAAL